MDGQVRMGMGVEGTDGLAGAVEDVLYDQDGVAQYLVIRDNGVFARSAVLPVANATVSGEVARYALSRAQIHAADRYDPQRYGTSAGLVSSAATHYDQQDKE